MRGEEVRGDEVKVWPERDEESEPTGELVKWQKKKKTDECVFIVGEICDTYVRLLL